MAVHVEGVIPGLAEHRNRTGVRVIQDEVVRWTDGVGVQGQSATPYVGPVKEKGFSSQYQTGLDRVLRVSIQ